MRRRESDIEDTGNPAAAGPTNTVLSMAEMAAVNGLVITAATIYLGWCYSEAFFAYFSLSPLDLGLSPMEYGLRGVGIIDQDLLLVLVLLLLSAVWIQRARPPVRAPRNSSMAPSSKLVKAKEAVLGAIGAVDSSVYRLREGIARHRTGTGLCVLILGIAVAASGEVTASRTHATLGLVIVGVLLVAASDNTDRASWIRPLAVAIAFLSAVWAVGLYAKAEGNARARRLAGNINKRTGATVYSEKPIGQLEDCGIKSRKAGKLYAYHGLHEIVHRSRTHYLVRSGWKRGNCVIAITIPDDGSIMVGRNLPPMKKG
jgi:hypothetical protein